MVSLIFIKVLAGAAVCGGILLHYLIRKEKVRDVLWAWRYWR